MQFFLLWGCIEKLEKAGVSEAFMPLLKYSRQGWWVDPARGWKAWQRCPGEVKKGGERHWQGGTHCPGKGTPEASEL